MSISEPIDFQPDVRTLEAIIAELADLGPASGGVIDAADRRAALATYAVLPAEGRAYPRGWRHDYARMRFDEVVWSSGRTRVPARRRPQPAKRADGEDLSALADVNAGGIVHAGSTYLEPAERLGDARVTLLSLADARRRTPERVDTIRGRIAAPEADRFTALTNAFQNCGAYVEIPSGVALDAPLQLVWSAQPAGVQAVFAQTIVRVGAHARATLVERHTGDAEAFVCGTVEVELGAGAQLDYVVLQQADEGSRLFYHRVARCAAGARIGWHAAELGGALSRSRLGTRLIAAQGVAETNVFFFAHAFAHADVAVEVEHDAAETTSHTIVRGAAADRARGRFASAIRIPQNSRHCVTSLRDDGLVLSRSAYLDSSPVLEVATSDVSASVSASVGSLAEDQLFYVQSRGIERSAAARMIALAFFEPAIERFPSDPLREEVRTALDARLDAVPDTFAS